MLFRVNLVVLDLRLALQGDFANALTIHHKFTELFSLLFVDGNPAGVKAMLRSYGVD